MREYKRPLKFFRRSDDLKRAKGFVDTDLATFAREGPEVKTRGRLSADPAELIHLQQKDATCGYASAKKPKTLRMQRWSCCKHAQYVPIMEAFLARLTTISATM